MRKEEQVVCYFVAASGSSGSEVEAILQDLQRGQSGLDSRLPAALGRE